MIRVEHRREYDEGSFMIEIPFLKWVIEIAVSEDGTRGIEDIMIFDSKDNDVTEDFLAFQSLNNTIKPTGINLFQIMDLLKTNLKKGE
jgi:hypothetical protein